MWKLCRKDDLGELMLHYMYGRTLYLMTVGLSQLRVMPWKWDRSCASKTKRKVFYEFILHLPTHRMMCTRAPVQSPPIRLLASRGPCGKAGTRIKVNYPSSSFYMKPKSVLQVRIWPAWQSSELLNDEPIKSRFSVTLMPSWFIHF